MYLWCDIYGATNLCKLRQTHRILQRQRTLVNFKCFIKIYKHNFTIA